MTLGQLGQIVWSGRWRLLLCTLAALAGALVISTRLPESYEAKARVILELVQADPVTGVTYDRKNTQAYVRTQQILATSTRVAERVIDKLGWTSNPQVIDAWTAQTGGVGDIRAWAALRLQSEIGAYPLEGGGTMEIAYRAPDPDAAETICRFVREAYIETALALQNEAAAKRAQRFAALAVPARARLAEAQAKLVAVQRANGIVVTPGGNDIEASTLARLQTEALSAQQSEVRRSNESAKLGGVMVMKLRQNLVATEQQIALAAGTLGTDNPSYRRLLSRRNELLAQLGRAEAGSRGLAAAAASAAGRISDAPEAAYQAERERVLNNAGARQQLVQAERLVAQRQAELVRLEANLANARQSSERTESGLVVMGDVITNQKPVFPNIPLNALLATLFGFGFGLASVLIDGLWRREVHGPADLAGATGVPVLAVVPGGGTRRPVWPRWLRWPGWRRGGSRAVPA